MKARITLVWLLITLFLAACSQTVQQPTPKPPPPHPVIEKEESRVRSLEEKAPASAPVTSDMAGAVVMQRMMAKKQISAYASGIPGRLPSEPLDRERYAHFDDNPVKRATETPVSTFSIDVDTGSYANLRRILNEGRLPPTDAVRVEELINYFTYDDQGPDNGNTPFHVTTEMGPNPWNSKTHLLRIGIKAWESKQKDLPPANLVFLLDVSGSMNSPDKLPLLKRSMRLLSRHLDKDDSVSIVVYAGASGVVLEPTPGDQGAKIEQALGQLQAGGSTNGGAGIRLAYLKAKEAFIKDGINRVILATDGDFNVGTVNHETLIDLIEEKRKEGIALTTLGFGTGNYNDQLMEQLADHGNGNYGYIDTLMEAQKVLVDELGATLHTVAKDVKIQIEFNPAQVSEYRLVGYENRVLAREDFNNDKVDAGEIGAGHSVTALYEVTLKGSGGDRIAPLRYGNETSNSTGFGSELAHLSLRYKKPDQESSILIETPVSVSKIKSDLEKTTDDYRFTAAVAAFGQQLRGGKYLADFSYPEIEKLAAEARGKDAMGYRSDLLKLVRLAGGLSGQR
ncbi:MAG: VWA domain-containing protein [Candidatus Sedimenticola sp. 6PFRAG5]